MKINFKSKLWLYGGEASWYFINLPIDVSADLKAVSSALPRRGFGSLKVQVKIGSSEWRTSIFPDSKSGCYLLPVKAAVRKSENIAEGDIVEVKLKIEEVI